MNPVILHNLMMADLNGPLYIDEKGQNRLHQAAASDDHAAIKKLSCKYPHLLNHADHEGRTPIFLAQSFEAFQALLEAGADWEPLWNHIVYNRYYPNLQALVARDDFYTLYGLKDRLSDLASIIKDVIYFDWPKLKPIMETLSEKGYRFPDFHSIARDSKVFSSLLNYEKAVEHITSETFPNRDRLSYLLDVSVMKSKWETVKFLMANGFFLPRLDQIKNSVKSEKLAMKLSLYHKTATSSEKKASLLSSVHIYFDDIEFPDPEQIRAVVAATKQLDVGTLFEYDETWTHQFIFEYKENWTLQECQQIALILISDYHLKYKLYYRFLMWVIGQSDADFKEKACSRVVDTIMSGRSKRDVKKLMAVFRMISDSSKLVDSLIDRLPVHWSYFENILDPLEDIELARLLSKIYFEKEPSVSIKKCRKKLLTIFEYRSQFIFRFRRKIIGLMKDNLTLPKQFDKLPDACKPYLLPLLLEDNELHELDDIALLAQILDFWKGSKAGKQIRRDIEIHQLSRLAERFPGCLSHLRLDLTGKTARAIYPQLISSNGKLSLRNKNLLLKNSKSDEFILPLSFASELTDEAFEIIQGSPILSANVWLIQKDPKLARALIGREFSGSEAKAFIKAAFHNPETFKPILESLLYVNELEIRPGAVADTSFHSFTRLLWRGIRSNDNLHTADDINLKMKLRRVYQQKFTPRPIQKIELLKTAEKTAKIYGRTVVVPGSKGNRAFKFLKVGEKVDELGKEAEAVRVMKEAHFQSLLPEPKGVFWVKETPEWIRNRVKGISSTSSQFVYSFDPPKGYYDYPNSPTGIAKNWDLGRKRWLSDRGKLIVAGQMPIDVPLFHNEENHRLYQILVDLFRESKSGAGRISAPLAGVAHPNASLETGARDFGDFIPISELIKNPALESSDLKDLSPREGATYFPLAAIAKMVLVDALLLVDRIDKQNRLDWQDRKVVSELADNLKKGHVWLLQSLTERSEEECQKFAGHSPVNWVRCAKQMIFWMQADDEGYVGALKKEKLPEGLYDPKTEIILKLKGAQNYTPDGGFRTKGQRDYGCFNGGLILAELEKLCYVTGVFARGLDHQY